MIFVWEKLLVKSQCMKIDFVFLNISKKFDEFWDKKMSHKIGKNKAL